MTRKVRTVDTVSRHGNGVPRRDREPVQGSPRTEPETPLRTGMPDPVCQACGTSATNPIHVGDGKHGHRFEGPRVARRAAVYLRVSTGGQSVENQAAEVYRIGRTRELTLVSEYTETASAGGVRPQFRAMMEAARLGAFDVLLIWALDRFGRSMIGNVGAVLELDRLGVEVVSVRESWLDTRGPVRSLLLAIFSWIAEQERTRLGERTRAGLERARGKGVKLGRPARRVDTRAAWKLRASGLSWNVIARKLNVPASTLARAVKERAAP